jgi:hypothetical protein
MAPQPARLDRLGSAPLDDDERDRESDRKRERDKTRRRQPRPGPPTLQQRTEKRAAGSNSRLAPA